MLHVWKPNPIVTDHFKMMLIGCVADEPRHSVVCQTLLWRDMRVSLPKCPYLSWRHIVFCSSEEMQPADGTRYSCIIKKANVGDENPVDCDRTISKESFLTF